VRKPQQFASLELAKQKILGYDVVREAATKGFDRGEEAVLYLIPRPGCLVIGSEELIKTIINGKRRGGVIEPRLMALTAIRKPLGYLAVGFPAVDDPRYQEEVGIDPNWLDEDDPLEHVIARLSYDEKTEKISVEATLRFKTGKAGPKLLEESAKGAIEAFKEQKIFPLIKTYFDKIQWRRDGVDLHISVTIHPNEMTGLFGGTGLVMYFLMAAPAVGLAPAPVLVAPAAAAAKKADKKKPAAKPTKKGVTEKPTPPKAKKKDG